MLFIPKVDLTHEGRSYHRERTYDGSYWGIPDSTVSGWIDAGEARGTNDDRLTKNEKAITELDERLEEVVIPDGLIPEVAKIKEDLVGVQAEVKDNKNKFESDMRETKSDIGDHRKIIDGHATKIKNSEENIVTHGDRLIASETAITELGDRIDQGQGQNPIIIKPGDIPGFASETLCSEYPMGYTLMDVAGVAGFTPGILMTNKLSESVCTQTWVVSGTGSLLVRTAKVSGDWNTFLQASMTPINTEETGMEENDTKETPTK